MLMCLLNPAFIYCKMIDEYILFLYSFCFLLLVSKKMIIMFFVNKHSCKNLDMSVAAVFVLRHMGQWAKLSYSLQRQ